MYKGNPTKVLTEEVRISYPSLFKPVMPQHESDPEKARYQLTILIPKSDTKTYTDIMQSIEACKQQAIAGVWNGQAPLNVGAPIYSGDDPTPQGGSFGDEAKGCWVVRLKSKNKPQVVHISNIGSQLLESDVYAGQYARVTFNVYAYAAAGRKGISFGLGNVMITRDGEPLSAGMATAESDFADFGGQGATAPTQGMINPLTGLPM